MEKNNPTSDQLNEAIQILEAHSVKRDYQKLDEILPLVLVILKSQSNNGDKASEKPKFYAPVWVSKLLERLSSDKQPLAQTEYEFFESLVRELSPNDYKSASPGLMGYQPQYITPEEISEIVLALKHYFKML